MCWMFICWNPNSQCDIWSWGLWEIIRLRWRHKGRAPDALSALISREENQSFLFFKPGEHIAKKAVFCKPGSVSSKDTKSACALILDFSAFRTVTNVSCLSHPVNGIFSKQPKVRHPFSFLHEIQKASLKRSGMEKWLCFLLALCFVSRPSGGHFYVQIASWIIPTSGACQSETFSSQH